MNRVIICCVGVAALTNSNVQEDKDGERVLRDRLTFGFTSDLSDPIRTGPFTPDIKRISTCVSSKRLISDVTSCSV